MIKRFAYIIFILLINCKIQSQNFGIVSSVKFPFYLESVFVDSIHDKLIVSSKYFYKAGNLPARGICSWNGSVWDSLAGGINTHDKSLNPSNPNGTAFCGIGYNGKLLVGGDFYSMGGVNATGMALWNGIKWDTLPVRPFRFGQSYSGVYGFLNYNSKLYLCGGFDTIQGQIAYSLATFDGISFQPIILPLDRNSLRINSMLVYKNELYIGGNFDSSSNPNFSDILKYNGSSWVSVGGGIKGSISSISSMVIYNDTLYAAGYFDKANGNAGNLIMKWDGLNWHDAGWGSTYDYNGIWKLLVHKNNLYAFGFFNYAADVRSSKVAIFNGTNWCSLHDTLNNNIQSATIFRDTIYVAGAFSSINGDTNKVRLAKIINPNCNGVGIEEYSNSHSIKIYPNPVSNTLYIESEKYFEAGTEIEITNTLGQIVLKTSFKNEIDVSSFSNGCYFLKIINADKQQLQTRFIKYD
jgi:hypothetical protein